ncbi:DUF1801 domain-containing protein [Candidatus Woesearchaeota archaeon]|nr:DUF1801 domain-containing protein [Candidatus Woesearchaeota archaeon]
MNKEVTEYINNQKSPQKEICRKLRILILKTVKVKEQKKLGVAWYGKFYIVGLKDSVNLGFSVKGLSKKDADNFKGQGKYMRHLKFKTLDEVDEKMIVKLIKLVDKKAECGSCYKYTP